MAPRPELFPSDWGQSSVCHTTHPPHMIHPILLILKNPCSKAAAVINLHNFHYLCQHIICNFFLNLHKKSFPDSSLIKSAWSKNTLFSHRMRKTILLFFLLFTYRVRDSRMHAQISMFHVQLLWHKVTAYQDLYPPAQGKAKGKPSQQFCCNSHQS